MKLKKIVNFQFVAGEAHGARERFEMLEACGEAVTRVAHTAFYFDLSERTT